jgi:hypothetical protein
MEDLYAVVTVSHLRFDALMVVKMSVVVFWVVSPCSLVGGYRRFEGTLWPPSSGLNAGGNAFFRNIGNHLQEYMAHYPQDHNQLSVVPISGCFIGSIPLSTFH